jgi:K+-transporting ATPase c subunit
MLEAMRLGVGACDARLHSESAVRTTLLTLLVTGLLYPLGMTLLAQLVFPSRAHGSLVTDEKGHVVGSSFDWSAVSLSPWYFQPRPIGCGRAGLRCGGVLGIEPGAELLEAARTGYRSPS